MPADPQLSHGQPGPPGPLEQHKDYFWHFAQFKVEGKVFQLPTRPFIEGSAVFSAKHGLTASGPDNKDGPKAQGRQDAIVLDVELVDFERFLKILLPSMMFPCSFSKPPMSKNEWISILKLSTLWSFSSLRSVAIEELSDILWNLKSSSEAVGSILDFVILARGYKVSWWLTQAYLVLIKTILQCRPLTLQEAGKIGHDTAHELQALALRRLQSRKGAGSAKKPTFCTKDLENIFLFGAEMAVLREEEKKYEPVSSAPGPLIVSIASDDSDNNDRQGDNAEGDSGSDDGGDAQGRTSDNSSASFLLGSVWAAPSPSRGTVWRPRRGRP